MPLVLPPINTANLASSSQDSSPTSAKDIGRGVSFYDNLSFYDDPEESPEMVQSYSKASLGSYGSKSILKTSRPHLPSPPPVQKGAAHSPKKPKGRRNSDQWNIGGAGRRRQSMSMLQVVKQASKVLPPARPRRKTENYPSPRKSVLHQQDGLQNDSKWSTVQESVKTFYPHGSSWLSSMDAFLSPRQTHREAAAAM